MKNTKHTDEMNGPANEQELSSQSKRKILTSIGVTSGVIGATALSQNWVKPVVNSVVLPAHAQATGTAPPSTATTTTTDPMMGTTTTTMPEPMSRIKVVAGQVSDKIGDGGTAEFHISLTSQPLNDVTVTVSADPSASLPTISSSGEFTFTRANYMTEQTVSVTAIGEVPADPMVTVKFAAAGGGYDDEEHSVMLTVVNDDDAAPTGLEGTSGTGMVTISWTAPDTEKAVKRYIVQVQAGASAPAEVSGDVANTGNTPVSGVYTINTSATSASFNVPGGVAYSYTVNAVFANSDEVDTYDSASSTTAVRSN